MRILIILIVLLLALPVGAGEFKSQIVCYQGKIYTLSEQSGHVQVTTSDSCPTFEQEGIRFDSPKAGWKTVKILTGVVHQNHLFWSDNSNKSRIFFYDEKWDRSYSFTIDKDYPLGTEVIMEIKIKIKEKE